MPKFKSGRCQKQIAFELIDPERKSECKWGEVLAVISAHVGWVGWVGVDVPPSGVFAREYRMIYRGPGFSLSYDLGPSPNPPPLSHQ